jgi:hypothetical protein
MKYKRPCPSHVWCDYHTSIHEAQTDYCDEGAEECRRRNWRPVYVASDDPAETF